MKGTNLICFVLSHLHNITAIKMLLKGFAVKSLLKTNVIIPLAFLLFLLNFISLKDLNVALKCPFLLWLIYFFIHYCLYYIFLKVTTIFSFCIIIN